MLLVGATLTGPPFLTLILLLAVLQGNTGVLIGMLLVSFVILVALVTVLSGIGVGEHVGMGSGGVYSMISSVLGGQMGGTIGLLYVFGQVRLPTAGHPAPACSLYLFFSPSSLPLPLSTWCKTRVGTMAPFMGEQAGLWSRSLIPLSRIPAPTTPAS